MVGLGGDYRERDLNRKANSHELALLNNSVFLFYVSVIFKFI